MLKSLFGNKKKGSNTLQKSQKTGLSPQVRDAIERVVGNKTISQMPETAKKTFALSVNPKAEAKDYMTLIESDESLTAKVLKIANSVYFDRGTKSTSVEQCVNVIGLTELKCLLNSSSLGDIYPSHSPMRAIIWAHDIAAAIAAKSLAQLFEPSKSEMAFVGGLMHDIGKLALIQKAQDKYKAIVDEVFDTGITFQEAEANSFPFDHTEVGFLIAQAWGFPDELSNLIREHHYPWEKLDTLGSLTCIIKLADYIAHIHGMGFKNNRSPILSKIQDESLQGFKKYGLSENKGQEIVKSVVATINNDYSLYS
jgi:putative nucleotidyltransferase with HDIG domain